ncbi:hypothetical protein [Cytobacillus kochii]|uniref:hypothetical protein n=1 Tax=Cytobacillus kochii TaxID=859143 RepID=UPI003F7DF82C
MKLEVGQVWESKEFPHENFRIYDGVVDTTVDAFEDEFMSFDEQPESCKIFFWERTNHKEFMKFVVDKKGLNSDSTYPYAWCGECKKSSIVRKIKKNNMNLINATK